MKAQKFDYQNMSNEKGKNYLDLGALHTKPNIMFNLNELLAKAKEAAKNANIS